MGCDMTHDDLDVLRTQCRMTNPALAVQEIEALQQGMRSAVCTDVDLAYRVVEWGPFAEKGTVQSAIWGWKLYFWTSSLLTPVAHRRLAADLSYLMRIDDVLWLAREPDISYSGRLHRCYSIQLTKTSPFRLQEYMDTPIAREELRNLYAVLKYLQRATWDQLNEPEAPPPQATVELTSTPVFLSAERKTIDRGRLAAGLFDNVKPPPEAPP